MNQINLTSLAVRVLLDTPAPTPSDAAYLFAQTIDNTPSVMATGLALLKSGATKRLLISGCGELSGYPGAKAYAEDLARLDVLPEQILSVPPPDAEIMHTTNESQALLRFAEQKRFTRLHIVASPLHQLRAFISSVSAVLKAKAPIALYSIAGIPLPWLDVVLHSQGKTQGSREDLVSGELERIARYRAFGDLASDDEVWSYLGRRDRGEI